MNRWRYYAENAEQGLIAINNKISNCEPNLVDKIASSVCGTSNDNNSKYTTLISLKEEYQELQSTGNSAIESKINEWDQILKNNKSPKKLSKLGINASKEVNAMISGYKKKLNDLQEMANSDL